MFHSSTGIIETLSTMARMYRFIHVVFEFTIYDNNGDKIHALRLDSFKFIGVFVGM